MPKHEEMDFPHTAVHCDDCWSQEVQMQTLAEIRRSNDLKEKELFIRQEGEWVEPKRTYRPAYIMPPKPTSTGKGGINID